MKLLPSIDLNLVYLAIGVAISEIFTDLRYHTPMYGEPTFKVRVKRPGKYFFYHAVIPFAFVAAIVLVVFYVIALAGHEEDPTGILVFVGLLAASVLWHVGSIFLRIVTRTPLLEISETGVRGFSYFFRTRYDWDDVKDIYCPNGKNGNALDIMRIVRLNKSPAHWVMWGFTFGRHEEYIQLPLKFTDASKHDILSAIQRHHPARIVPGQSGTISGHSAS